MTPFEWLRSLARPLLPALQARVTRDLAHLLRADAGAARADVLDVGGRRSPYTVGLDARITILDLPREAEVQHQLNLGMTAEIEDQLARRRSNIDRVLLGDLRTTDLPDDRFDGVVAVEVIEHVPDDVGFVRAAARVLRPGGWVYFTTPNGDYIKNEGADYNPDHVRHYTRDQLAALLAVDFEQVEVVYGIRTGRWRAMGLRSFSLRHPVRLARSLYGNLRSHLESRGLDEVSQRTAHLLARARKPLTRPAGSRSST